MYSYEGEITFSRELTATEIIKIRSLLEQKIPNSVKPNNGIFPLEFLKNFNGLVWDKSITYELDGVIRELVKFLPEGVFINGVFRCIEDEETGGYPYKIIVNNNVVTTMGIEENPDDKPKLLKCPHCQKVFKAEDFKEVIT